MSRKLTAAVVALAVAGGVYLSGGTAEASNMGFKLERAFTYVPLTGYRNIYYKSYPLFNGLADTARASGSGDRCAGPPDGQVTMEDAICDEFTDRATCGTCSFTMLNLNTATCQNEPLVASKNALGLNFQGTSLPGGRQLTEDPQREVGYQINVTGQAANPPVNRAVIVGSDDPSWVGQRISVATCPRVLIGMPYHTMYRKAAEVICGLANDLVNGFPDADGDTAPDGTPATRVCPHGIFDTVSGKRITILTYDNEPGNDEFPGTSGQFISLNIERNALGLQINGNNFSLKAGEGYLVNLQNGHNDTTLLPPHF